MARRTAVSALTLLAVVVAAAFPQAGDGRSQGRADLRYVELSYETRSGHCIGCAEYSITIRGSGWVYLKMKYGAIAEATLRISDVDVRALVQAFESARFFDIPRLDTQHSWTDVSHVTVAYRDQTRTHEVLDVNRQMPALTALEMRILNTVGIQRFLEPSLAVYQELVASKRWRVESDRETALGAAAAARDMDSVRFLLEHRAFLSEATLVAACGGGVNGPGDPAIVSLLLDTAGAAAASSAAGRMLIAAAGADFRDTKGDTRVLRLLLDRGADANSRELDTGETPLLRAVSNESPAAVKLLLSRGAKVDLADRNGETALMRAVQLCRETVVPLLLAAGANTKLVDNTNRTALQFPNLCAQVRALLQARQ